MEEQLINVAAFVAVGVAFVALGFVIFFVQQDKKKSDEEKALADR